MGPHCVTNWWKLRNNRWIITHTCNYIYLYVLIMYGMHTYTVHLLFKNHMGMDQYLLIPFLGGWTSIYQLFWCSPGVQGFDTLQYDFGICTHVAWILNGGGSGKLRTWPKPSVLRSCGQSPRGGGHWSCWSGGGDFKATQLWLLLYKPMGCNTHENYSYYIKPMKTPIYQKPSFFLGIN